MAYPPPKMLSIAKARYSDRSREMTMVRGTYVNIGRFNVDNLEKRHALDLLRSNCSLAALVDAQERYDPPRCNEETRRNISKKIEDWVHCDTTTTHDAPSGIFWLYGGAGAGKSALAQTLAEKFRANEDLAASFFFFKADANRNDGDRLIPTLANQLVQSFYGLAPFLEEKIVQHPDLFMKSRWTQMLELVVEPLIRLSVDEADGAGPNATLTSHPRLVVIDGLDECVDQEIQCDLLRIIASTALHLPYPLRILITSRPESHIARLFEHDLTEAARYNLSDDSDANKDIRSFLEKEFTEIHRTHPLRQYLPAQWPCHDDISSIVERSSGHFVYPSTVIRFVQSPQHRPDDRLEVVLGLQQEYEKDRPYARLDSLYRFIFLGIQDPVQLEAIHRAFGITHLRSLKSGLLASPQWTSDRHAIESLLVLRPGDLVLLLHPLRSLVSLENDNLRIFHKSLFDYLLDSTRCGDLVLDLALAHESAANHIVRLKKIKATWESADLENFSYHCQFARLNKTLTGHLCSLACDPEIIFAKSFCVPSKDPRHLQSIINFLQAIDRRDLDCRVHSYGTYVEKETNYLRSTVSWSQRSKTMISSLTHFMVAGYVKQRLCSLFESFNLKAPQLEDEKGSSGKMPIPSASKSVMKTIEKEHDLFSSYLEAHYQYPNIAVSFLESSARLLHSCHFAFHPVSPVRVTTIVLVTYNDDGVRLSCSKFEDLDWVPHYDVGDVTIGIVAEAHFRTTMNSVNNTHIVIRNYLGRIWGAFPAPG